MTDLRARRPRLEAAVLLTIVALYVTHRVLVILSAGDFLHPLEPSEAKHTQIAWDLMSGRFGEPGYRLFNYVTNTGSVHHGSYSTAALAYCLVGPLMGFSMVSVRVLPLLCWAIALVLLLRTANREFGLAAAALGGLGAFMAPTIHFGYEVTFIGSHSEAVLPLVLCLAAWVRASSRARPSVVEMGFLGLMIGYCGAFSYLLWPMLALLGLLTLVPPIPRPPWKAWLGFVCGIAAGLWPVWLIFALGGTESLFGTSITENPDTTLANQASGGGWERFEQTFVLNLPSGMEDYWMRMQDVALTFGLDLWFEQVAHWGMAMGPLVLLPFALLLRQPAARRVALFFALAPPLAYVFLAWATPFAPEIPKRYLLPLGLLGRFAPGVGVGVALLLWQQGSWRRVPAVPLLLVCVLWLGGQARWRVPEALDNVRLERAAANLEHRYVSYYNLGMGTVWSQMVPEINDLLDVRSAEADGRAFAGIQAGLWGSGRQLSLGLGDWAPPELTPRSLTAGLNEWAEREAYKTAEQRDDPRYVAWNFGWGAAIRAGWDLGQLDAVLRQAVDSPTWPPDLSIDAVWAGVGFGWGRAHPGEAPALPAGLNPVWAESFHLGVQAGRDLGPVPPSPHKPVFASIRGPAT